MVNMLQKECTKQDIFALSHVLSEADYRELIASESLKVGETLADCLTRCVEGSVKTYSIYCEGAILAIGGYTENGNCWFLSSKHLGNLSVTQRREFRCMLMTNLLDTLRLFPKLQNIAYRHNVQHLKLITSCGGHLMQEIRLGDNQPFVYFEFRREDFPQLKEV